MVRKTRNYFIPPPIIGTVYKYQDVNKDKTLRKDITNFFRKKLFEWLDEDYYKDIKSYFQVDGSQVKKLDKQDKSFKDSKLIKDHIYQHYYSYKKVYKLLRAYVKKYDVNWWDLRKTRKHVHAFIVKYLKTKLSSSE
jgi:hypothetical protein